MSGDEGAAGGGSAWRGSRVRLRAFEPADREVYDAWDQDSDQARNLSAIPFPRSAEAIRRTPRQHIRETDGEYRWPTMNPPSGSLAAGSSGVR